MLAFLEYFAYYMDGTTMSVVFNFWKFLHGVQTFLFVH